MGGPNFNATVTGRGNPAVRGISTTGNGVDGNTTSGNGVVGNSTSGFGVHGISDDSYGVKGEASADDVAGVLGESTSGDGAGVQGTNTSNGAGVVGECARGAGVGGRSESGIGVNGFSTSGIGTNGSSDSGFGVGAFSTTNIGVSSISNGTGDRGIGMDGFTRNGAVGVRGISLTSTGVLGTGPFSGVQGTSNSGVGTGVSGVSSTGGTGVRGISGTPSTTSSSGVGVFGSGLEAGVKGEGGFIGVHGRVSGPAGMGVFAEAVGTAVLAQSTNGIAIRGSGPTAGDFQGFVNVNGNVDVNGDLTVTGRKPFKIDHPLDPQNKYLLHNVVESSEMKNVYDGVAQLDEDGAAWVELPEWFEALNGDFRYQLTAVGGSAPNLHVAEEISENRFRIAGGEEGMNVCWQLTGSRKDPWAAANPFEVEQEKPEEERGRYLHPGLYGASEEQRVMRGPPIPEAVEEEQRPPEPSGIDFARLEEEELRRLDEWRRIVEEQRREIVPPSFDYVRLEEERLRQLDEWRRIVEEQRREMEEEGPPEST